VRKIPIDLNATLREEPDKTLTIVMEISGIPTTEATMRGCARQSAIMST
jgi:hypothetical protein